mmetsp:Transcript_9185/g.21802  ORF Transcript_9185/g.21802 Transcript_9185/m.21802 type:complete len:87 (+) Transcript_9185:16-276(+)
MCHHQSYGDASARLLHSARKGATTTGQSPPHGLARPGGCMNMQSCLAHFAPKLQGMLSILERRLLTSAFAGCRSRQASPFLHLSMM